MNLASDENDSELDLLLRAIRDSLSATHQRLVTAESCTAGFVAAELGQIPGISESWCGSLVAYRKESKFEWLGIDRSILDDPLRGPVSEDATRELARAALQKTSEATIAAAVTGHLGPNSPPGMDGHVFTAVAKLKYREKDHCSLHERRTQAAYSTLQPPSEIIAKDKITVDVQHHRLRHFPPQSPEDWIGRERRQKEAAQLLFRHLFYSLS